MNILITGATGLIGTKLLKNLSQKGHNINILSRNPEKNLYANTFKWDVESQEIDLDSLKNVDTIINLAGAGIAEKRWTKSRKRILVESRTESIKLLYKAIEQTGTPVKTIISASAVGYYGDRGDEVLTEESQIGTGFLAYCSREWEDAIDEGSKFGARIVKLRIGIVLSRLGGALAELEKPVSYFAGAPLGTGKQWMPWIHLYDMAAIFEKVVEDQSYEGTYNAASPFPVTNHEFTRVLAKKLNRPVWPVNVPVFMLKTILGEMSAVVLSSNRISSQKLLDTGFEYRYSGLESALDEIYTQ